MAAAAKKTGGKAAEAGSGLMPGKVA